LKRYIKNKRPKLTFRLQHAVVSRNEQNKSHERLRVHGLAAGSLARPHVSGVAERNHSSASRSTGIIDWFSSKYRANAGMSAHRITRPFIPKDTRIAGHDK
jgi:hypothetical protein